MGYYWSFTSGVENWVGSDFTTDPEADCCPASWWENSHGYENLGCLAGHAGTFEGGGFVYWTYDFVAPYADFTNDYVKFYYRFIPDGVSTRDAGITVFITLSDDSVLEDEDFPTYDLAGGDSGWLSYQYDFAPGGLNIKQIQFVVTPNALNNTDYTFYIDDVQLGDRPPAPGFYTGTTNPGVTLMSDLPFGLATPDGFALRDYLLAAIGSGEAAQDPMIRASADYLYWNMLEGAQHNIFTDQITSLRWLPPCVTNVGTPTGGITIPTNTGETITIPAGQPGQVLSPGDNPGDPPQWVDNPVITDHGALTGLTPDDDHPHYWNDMRGDQKISDHAGDADAHHNWPPDWSDIAIDVLGTPTRDRLDEMISSYLSCGFVQGGAITDNLDGTIDIAAGAGWIRATDDDQATILSFEWGAVSSLALTAEQRNYVYVDYNAGSPTVLATTNLGSLDHHTNFVLALVFGETNHVHVASAGQKLNDFIHRFYYHAFEHDGLERSSGMVTSETGTRNLDVTAGVLYWALERMTTLAIDTSGADDFDYYYRDGIGGWTEVSAQTQIDNAYWDDGTGTLNTLTANRYGVHWVFLTPDSGLYVLYGRGDYTLSQAQEAGVPSTMPTELSDFAILIAKIIVQQGASSLYSIEYPWEITFQTGGGVSDHNSLSGLQGGTAAEYYHLTSAEYAALGAATWPFDKVYTVSSTNADADFSSVATALATVATNSVLLLDVETHATTTKLDCAGKTIAIVGMGDYYDTIINMSSGDNTTLTNDGGYLILKNVTIRQLTSNPSGTTVAVHNDGGWLVMDNAHAYASNPGAVGSAIGLYADSTLSGAVTTLRDSLCTGIRTGVTSNGDGLKTTVSGGNTVNAYDTYFSGSTTDLNNTANASVVITDARLNNGVYTGTVLGTIFDAGTGELQALGGLSLATGPTVSEIVQSILVTSTHLQLPTAAAVYNLLGGGGTSDKIVEDDSSVEVIDDGVSAGAAITKIDASEVVRVEPGLLKLYVGTEIGYQGSAAPFSQVAYTDLLQRIAHLREFGHPVNPYPVSRNSLDSEFNNTAAADNNDLTVAGAGTWDQFTASTYTPNVNTTRASHLYVRVVNEITNINRNITRVGATDSLYFKCFLSKISGEFQQPWRFIFRIVDTVTGNYVGVQIETNTTADDIFLTANYDNGGGSTVIVSQQLGYLSTGPFYFAIRRYESGGNCYSRHFFYGADLDDDNSINTFATNSMGLSSVWRPDLVKLYFQSYNAGDIVNFEVDSVRFT